MKNVVILGATSAIAEHCARLWAEEGATLHLVARDGVRLEQVAQDLRARGATGAIPHVHDVRDRGALASSLAAAKAPTGRIDIVLVAFGTLPDQRKAETDVAYAVDAFDNNATATLAALLMLADLMQDQGGGTIAVISSVAGDRGRASNHLYGAAKGAVSIFCEGLRARLFVKGVRVLLVKPGFVDTPMTKDLALPALLVATPARVARDIVRAVGRGRSTIYTPFWWRAIMLVIRHIPGTVLKRLRF